MENSLNNGCHCSATSLSFKLKLRNAGCQGTIALKQMASEALRRMLRAEGLQSEQLWITAGFNMNLRKRFVLHLCTSRRPFSNRKVCTSSGFCPWASKPHVCSTWCLPRLCIGVASVLPRFGTVAEPKRNRGKQKVEHMCVLPFVYLGVASVLLPFCPGAEPQQKRSKTEAKPK